MTTSPAPEGRPNWRNPRHLLAYGLGSGAAPVAPGTFGTLAAIPLALLLQPLEPAPYLALVILLFLLGIPICGRTAQDLGLHDPGGIVFDEWVGLLLTLWLAPPGWPWLLAGFLLFRLFDIWKPWPIRWLDRRVGGGLGIMLDDLLAGLFAFVFLQLGVYLWRGPAWWP
jgi:phosphatidylglycerophosphatase A